MALTNDGFVSCLCLSSLVCKSELIVFVIPLTSPGDFKDREKPHSAWQYKMLVMVKMKNDLVLPVSNLLPGSKLGVWDVN